MNFYNFYCWFLINPTTYITDCNKFDIKLIIHPLSKLKILNYKLLILHENKLHYTWDIIHKLEPLAQNLKICYKLTVDNYNCGSSIWIIGDLSIKLIDIFISLYSLDLFFY